MDFTSLYSTRIQESFDEDQERIFRAIRGSHTAVEPPKVQLLNYYKGLPIMYPGKILGVERGVVDIDVNPYQAVAIDEDRYTFIRSKLFPFALVARVQYVNIKKHVVSLSRLGYVEILAEKRATVRLEMAPPVDVSLRFGDRAVSGRLADLSTQGAGVHVADRFDDLDFGTEMTLKFLLPDPVLMKQTLVAAPARFVAVVGEAAPYLCKLKLVPAKHYEHLISRYSFQRQVDIIRSIKERVG